MTLPPDQGRAPHLYDEQLQRVQQEKMLAEAAKRPFLLGKGPASEAKAGAA
jgi:hypothetical protein